MGKLIDNFKNFLDKTAEILNNKAEEIENGSKQYNFDYETAIDRDNYPTYEKDILESKNTSADIQDKEKEKENGPIALDVFGNYIYFNDKVIDVDYNDKRHAYISVNKLNAPYAFCSMTGPIYRNVILKSAFTQRKKDKKITEKGNFYHIERI
ncbi:MAG: hypothetical protein [Wendovervirus sonii]|uniref:KTSC domain-containing protein n=1 Tax=phage Lak_Megaphage_Sonny TaxID=3109229 RepID=A0ABZ0Z325_9CAUD|nr:MAG: hypothetical protein [phage Lak_Megaphage_Sonny]